MSSAVVRDAASCEVDELLAVAERCAGAARWSRPIWAETVCSTQGPGATRAVKVMSCEQGIVGFGVMHCTGPAGEGCEGELENLGVLPEMRRQGYGKQLCTELLRWACARGAHEVRLEVRAQSAEARALYAGLGFSEECRRKGYYREPNDEAVLLKLSCSGDLAEATLLRRPAEA